jgi:hypothetical protein
VNRWNRLAFVVIMVGAYIVSYVVLSRRGYADAVRDHSEGFYYFAPEDSDRWRFWNYSCVGLYWPLNVLDRGLGLGRASGKEPLWKVSATHPE